MIITGTLVGEFMFRCTHDVGVVAFVAKNGIRQGRHQEHCCSKFPPRGRSSDQFCLAGSCKISENCARVWLNILFDRLLLVVPEVK